LRSYQHSRECRIENGGCGGPDVSTLRRWLKALSVPLSILFLFLSAIKQSMAAATPPSAVMFLSVFCKLKFPNFAKSHYG
jgi:transcriptional regulator with XRE-family HTH domain